MYEWDIHTNMHKRLKQQIHQITTAYDTDKHLLRDTDKHLRTENAPPVKGA